MRLSRTLCVGACSLLAGAPAALADTAQSTNWAGYATHGSGVSYKTVRGAWVEPRATCVRGHQSFSSYWVGIGGYSETSQALEQVGTEVDCSASGKVLSTAWYELVPAPSTPIRMTVNPGDVIQASVTVNGRSVTVNVYDATRRHRFTKTVRASVLDLTSADWIVEAPSQCFSATECLTLPLANFGTATFNYASAQTVRGTTGTISSPMWQATKISLQPNSRRFLVNTGSGPVLGVATPLDLQAGGTSFTVNYSQVPVIGGAIFSAKDAQLRAGHIVHPTN